MKLCRPSPGDPKVAYPPCKPGNEVLVDGRQSGDKVFSLTVPCVEPIEASSATPVAFDGQHSTKLSWVPPKFGKESRVLVRVEPQKAPVMGIIQCDAADSGVLTIDSTLISQLREVAGGGGVGIRISRINTASVAVGAGSTSLNMRSDVWLDGTL